jgi:anti-sigma factor RsiW
MTDCEAVKPKLGRFVDGELVPAEQVSVQAHLKECSTCRDELTALQSLSASLDRLAVPPVPEALAAAVTSRVRTHRAGRWRAAGVFEFWTGWSKAMRLATCTTAMIACLIGLVLGSSASAASSRTQSEMAWVGLSSGGPITSAYLETAR